MGQVWIACGIDRLLTDYVETISIPNQVKIEAVVLYTYPHRLLLCNPFRIFFPTIFAITQLVL